ncbi:MAG: DUF2203 family protein [Planctomycetota bacterium]
MHKFTLAQCNAILPLVRAVAGEIAERRRHRSSLLRERAALRKARTPEGLTEAVGVLDGQVCEEEDGIHRACRELQRYGLSVVRLNPLVVHFPGKAQKGDEVDDMVFCWQEDEPAVSHAHPQGQEQEPRFPLKLPR